MSKKKQTTNKFNNKKVEVNGIKFDSKMESDYYLYILEMCEEGIIEEFELQPEFILQQGFTKRGIKFLPIKYKADFEVWLADGTNYVIDIKGFKTADFNIKAKMFEKLYPQELKLITFSRIDGGWIELDDLKEARKLRKLEKEKGKK
ncbi:hypothetical protein CN367_11905 [Priestia megaterium]|uniref:DUF1064 domain-containing protein n=1 Tax=Priestia megaterium TaxID=1404 RepID=UPI000BF92A5E|nr:DUF1064 domain-containing protein [Priestia megaterium]PEZ47063.1 hypothetical protein CN367_11905 [Priestia megaterium]